MSCIWVRCACCRRSPSNELLHTTLFAHPCIASRRMHTVSFARALHVLLQCHARNPRTYRAYVYACVYIGTAFTTCAIWALRRSRTTTVSATPRRQRAAHHLHRRNHGRSQSQQSQSRVGRPRRQNTRSGLSYYGWLAAEACLRRWPPVLPPPTTTTTMRPAGSAPGSAWTWNTYWAAAATAAAVMKRLHYVVSSCCRLLGPEAMNASGWGRVG